MFLKSVFCLDWTKNWSLEHPVCLCASAASFTPQSCWGVNIPEVAPPQATAGSAGSWCHRLTLTSGSASDSEPQWTQTHTHTHAQQCCCCCCVSLTFYSLSSLSLFLYLYLSLSSSPSPSQWTLTQKQRWWMSRTPSRRKLKCKQQSTFVRSAEVTCHR